MGFVKGGAATLVAAAAVLVGVLKGPANPISLEIVDAVDQLLDRLQGGVEEVSKSRYLNGIFAPTRTEVNEGPGLELELVSGGLPEGLDGLFFKVGPNLWTAPTKQQHVFDGDGMVHTIRIKGGKAFYHNAFLETERLKFERQRGGLFFRHIGELTGLTGLAKVMLIDKAKMADIEPYTQCQANTAVNALPDGRLWASFEECWPFGFRVSERGEIASVGYETAGGRLRTPMSAHPKVDRKTGETFFHAYTLDGGRDGKTFLAYGRLDNQGGFQEYFALNATGPSFSHDMLLSEHYTIVMESSVRFKPENMPSGRSVFSFDPDFRARLGVIPREAKSAEEVRWFETPVATGWVHPIHAWEEDGGRTLVLWSPLGKPTVGEEREGGIIEGCCDLWHMGEIRIDLQTGKVTMEFIDEDGRYHGEFSRLRDELVGQGFTRYGYTAASDRVGKADFDFIGFTKWDFKEKKVAKEMLWEAPWIGTEPIFIPAPQPSGEPSDDGYLATLLHGPDLNSTDFALFDARTLSSEPVVRLRIPKRVPVGFHGNWLSREQLDNHLERWAAKP